MCIRMQLVARNSISFCCLCMYLEDMIWYVYEFIYSFFILFIIKICLMDKEKERKTEREKQNNEIHLEISIIHSFILSSRLLTHAHLAFWLSQLTRFFIFIYVFAFEAHALLYSVESKLKECQSVERIYKRKMKKKIVIFIW